MSRITKTKTYEVITCDFCDADMENNLGFERCPVCGKDICKDHTVVITQGGKQIDKICPECFSQAMYGLVAKKVKEIVEAMD